MQGGVHQDLRIASAQAVIASGAEGIAIGGSLGRDKAQMHEVVDWTTRELERGAPTRPRHLLGMGEIDEPDPRCRARGGQLRLRDADAARTPRRGVIDDPTARWRVALDRAAVEDERAAAAGWLPMHGVCERPLARPTCTTSCAAAS